LISIIVYISQIHKLHGFVQNPCKFYHFISSYCLNMNVMHYLNTKIVCTTFCVNKIDIQHLYLYNMNRHMIFVFKQCGWHQCSNNTSKWMTFMSIPYEPIKSRFCMTIIAKLWPMKFIMYKHLTWTLKLCIYWNLCEII
jgi:hypothetical protein